MPPLPPAARLPLLILGVLSLIVGVLAGLARLAVDIPTAVASHAGVHGALMIAAFLGTVISLERAVALMRGWAFLAPLAAGLGGLALLAGRPVSVAQLLFCLAGATLSFGSSLLFFRHPALYLATLALGALSWLIGNLAWWLSGNIFAAVPWWMAFLILTIAGERLELTRFLPTTRIVQRSFAVIIATMLAGLTLAFWAEADGLGVFAAGLVALSIWLLRNDIARRTVKQTGLTRFIALCLLGGYLWLIVGGLLGVQGGFAGSAAGTPLRDAALHSIFLGFVFSMIFGHAPIIFPAVAKVRIDYHPFFYVPWLLLHASLLLRVIADLLPAAIDLRAPAGIMNGIALALFIVTMLFAVLRTARRKRTMQRATQ
ncbi:conserved membrane protein of unknown function [Sterolibacterium denitrificans]|uniref:NnrS family protein n=1 Tax=Sterolibacterium denitrificans TaxID=157592 RepID=A0A7Z7HQU0_9PROT|nr:hypothetical protein [Sterolibacterium denitrificans]SMB26014.1 conserved membrane protein of unknown function [Sterolibacterium denitrificans]